MANVNKANDKIKRITQVGMVVRNREQAMEYFDKYLGINEWEVTDCEKIPVEETGLEVDGKPGSLNMHIAIATMENGFELEIIEPIGPCPYMDYLNEHGPGVHHFAIVMPDRNARFQALMDEMNADGINTWVHAKMTKVPGGMDFAYMDAREQMGAMIEMYNEPRD